MTREIPLTRGFAALVDKEDWAELSQFKWYVLRNRRRGRDTFYAARSAKGRRVSMHRQVLDAQKGEAIDHKNGNGLDNRRRNLRLATASENMANQLQQARNKSGFRGVSFNRARRKWQVSIGYRRRILYLGLFKSAEDAARTYDKAARRLFGEFARPNFNAEEAGSSISPRTIPRYIRDLSVPWEEKEDRTTCELCGGPVPPRPRTSSGGGRYKKYCSNKCGNRAWMLRNPERHRENNRKTYRKSQERRIELVEQRAVPDG